VEARVQPNGGPAIGICGSYGGLNVGDEAILTVALNQLRSALPAVELTVFTRNVEHTRSHHAVHRVVGARAALRDELVREVERLDLLLLGGGGILYDREAEWYLQLPRIAQSLGVPTGTYAIGAGPLELPDDRRAVAEVLNGMVGITVRDVGARRLLEEIGVEQPVRITADPALLLEPSAPPGDVLARLGVDSGRHLVGMSVREPGGGGHFEDSGYHRVLADAADFVADRYDANLVFVPMERQDVSHAHRVIAEMLLPERASVLRESYGPREVLGIMGQLDMAVGMRLHFAIFAAVAGVPFLALPYAAKVTAFLERIGRATPQLAHPQHAGTLLAAIDRMWDYRRQEVEQVQARLPGLREVARRTAAIAAELLLPKVHHAPVGAT
jgi:polysaccharide pyruvyl transferase CsaB